MQDVQSKSPPAPPSPVAGQNGDGAPGGTDPLAKLYRMSTTAGAGTQEYVAINPTAVAALLLGLSSILIVLSNILLLIPLAGAICAIIALVQIRRSNQTQTGLGLAIFGLLLCILVSGGRVGYQALTRHRAIADEKQIATVLHEFGQAIGANDYQKAYQLCDQGFRDRVTLPVFTKTFMDYRTEGPIGGVHSMAWNHQPMSFEDSTESGNAYASAMAFYRFENDPLDHRVVMGFEKSDGMWRVHDINVIFPSFKKP